MLSTLLFALATLQSPPSFGLERYEVDAGHSTVGFDGASTLHDFTGKTHAITGDLRVDRDDPERIAGGAVWIEARTLDTDNESRDGDMRDLLAVKQFPQIVFRLDSVKGKLVHGKGEFTAQGRFTIKGVEKTREIKFHVDPIPPRQDNSGHDIRVQGEVTFKMTEHGIDRPGILFVKVRDDVRVWLDLTLRPIADAGMQARVRTLQVEEEFAPKGSAVPVTKRSGTELLWTAGSRRLWERRLDPDWAVTDAHGLVAVDPRTGQTQPPPDLLRQAWDSLSKPGDPGTTWTTTVDEAAGRRTLRVTLGEEAEGRLPMWALDPRSWSNGPEPTR